MMEWVWCGVVSWEVCAGREGGGSVIYCTNAIQKRGEKWTGANWCLQSHVMTNYVFTLTPTPNPSPLSLTLTLTSTHTLTPTFTPTATPTPIPFPL